MSWLFPDRPKKGDSNEENRINEESNENDKNWQGFDPTGLERAAKAARELDASRNSKNALDIAKQQEITKQQKYLAHMKEKEASIEHLKIERVKVEQEEKRRTIQHETQQHNQRAQYNDQLSRKRHEDQLMQQKRSQEEIISKQEESVRRQEAIRRETIKYETDIKHNNEMTQIEAKARAKAKIERENRDIRLEKLKAEAVEYRHTILETVKTSLTMIGNGFESFISDPNKIATTVTGLSLLALGIYSSKSATKVVAKYIESHIGKPSLVRETSRLTFSDLFRHPFKTISKYFRRDRKDFMDGMIFDKELENRLVTVAQSTKIAHKNDAFLRNLLFYGPPGTGKTLFAKNLAQKIGLDYAIMTGGDIGPLGANAVTALHKVFDWSSTSKKGLILFLDEADAFLKKRNSEVISEELRSALNAFLYRTGESSKNFMFILATNQPSQLDRAIGDRVDEMIEFNLPGFEERKRLISYYFNHYVLQAKNIKVDMNFKIDDQIDQFSKLTLGLSGREISKLIISWQASAHSKQDCTLTLDDMMKRISDSKKQLTTKISWSQKLKSDYGAIDHLSMNDSIQSVVN